MAAAAGALGGCAGRDAGGCRLVEPGNREGSALVLALESGSHETERFHAFAFYLPGASRRSRVLSSDPHVARISRQGPHHGRASTRSG